MPGVVMDTERATQLVAERMKRGLCVQCAEPLSRTRDEVFWCTSCRARPRCCVCGTPVAFDESRCEQHRLFREVLL